MDSDILFMAMQYYSQTLKTNQKMMSYLLGRGLKEETIHEMNIGYADGTFHKHMETKGKTLQQILDSRLIRQSKENPNVFFDFFSHRIVFPITILGDIKYMAGRDMTNREGVTKYKNIPLKNMFYINEELLAYNPGYVILTEGFVDCYMMVQAGFPALGVSGCNTKRKDVLNKLLKVPTVFIMFDSEDNNSGLKGSAHTAFNLVSMGHRDVRMIDTPRIEGRKKTDINDLYLHCLGEENFKLNINYLIANAIRFNNSALHQKMVTDIANKEILFDPDLPAAESYKIFTQYVDFELTSPGAVYVQGPCPIHEETKGSFTLYLSDMAAHCFGCGFHGTALDLKRAMERKQLLKTLSKGF